VAARLRVRELTEEEREAITRLAHARTVSARVVERARIIECASQGWRVAAISRALQISEKMVRLWIRRFNAAGVDGLEDAPRSGRPATYTLEQVGEVLATALTNPQHLGLPFGCWTIDRLEAYLNEEKDLPIKRSRIAELLLDEGLRWRMQESWFGERAAVEPDTEQAAAPIKKEREVDPDFAQKRGPSQPSIRLLPPAV
jgi:transposase